MKTVMILPVLNEMCRGARFEKSFEGETTLAAMLTEIWATTMAIMAMTNTTEPAMRAMSWTGSQIGSPKTTTVAAVTAIPTKLKAVMLVGSPTAWPTTCARWLVANRVKSGMLRESVIQY